jgi:hypothetical protein
VDNFPLQNVGVHVVKVWSAFSLTQKISYTEHAQQFFFFFFFLQTAEIIFIHSGNFRGFSEHAQFGSIFITEPFC